MTQVKKQEIREAIVASAYALFRDKGYNETSVAEIARSAGIAPSNVYIYFESKFDVLYAIYDPYLRARLSKLERDLERIEASDDRLRLLFQTIWHDIPWENSGFANNLMQGLSTVKPGETVKQDLLHWTENKLAELILLSLPPERARNLDGAGLARIALKAFDGFSISAAVSIRTERPDDAVDAMVSLLLGRDATSSATGSSSVQRRVGAFP